MKTDFFTDEELSAVSVRAWKNLNAMAETLIKNKNLTPLNPMQISELARRTGLDTSHATRLLTNKPGFVKVLAPLSTYNNETSSSRDVRTVGYYYLQRFADPTGNYSYPKTLITLLKQCAETPPKCVMLDNAYSKNEVKGDNRLVAQYTHIDDSITVPVRRQPPAITTEAICVALNINEAPLAVMPISALSERDLGLLLDGISEKLATVASLYYTVLSELEDREVR